MNLSKNIEKIEALTLLSLVISFHLAVRQLICRWNLLTAAASVNLTQRLCHSGAW